MHSKNNKAKVIIALEIIIIIIIVCIGVGMIFMNGGHHSSVNKVHHSRTTQQSDLTSVPHHKKNVNSTKQHVKQPKVSDNSDTSWHAGAPEFFQTDSPTHSVWISNYIKNKQGGGYTVISTDLNQKYGFNSVPFNYNSHKQFLMTGADDSAYEAQHPYYKKVGNNTYLMTSGNKTLQGDLDNIQNPLQHLPSAYILVQVRNGQVYLWFLGKHGLNGKRHFMGVFHQSHMSWNQLYKKNDAIKAHK